MHHHRAPGCLCHATTSCCPDFRAAYGPFLKI
jgi:hypothetical protein